MQDAAYYTVAEAAQRWRVSKGLVYKLIEDGKISPVLKITEKAIRIPKKTLRDYEGGLCETEKKGSGSGAASATAYVTSSQVQVQKPDAFQRYILWPEKLPR